MTNTTGVVFKREDCAGFGVRVLVDLIDILVAAIAVVVIAFPLLQVIPDNERPEAMTSLPRLQGHLDKTANRRFTTCGHDDRSCWRCHGNCYVEDDETAADRDDATE